MGRPPMRVGEHGTVSTRPDPDHAGQFIAVVNVRDGDGRTRRVQRAGRTAAAARRALTDHLAERHGPSGAGLTRDSRVRDAAAVWMGIMEQRRAATTLDQYRGWLDAYVLPALGDLRVHEVTVERVDVWMAGLEARGLSVSTRRNARKALAGPLRTAVRYGAIATNPIRDAMPVEGAAPKAPVALTADQCADLLRIIDTDELARVDDVPDLVRFMLGTGVRIGEALAPRWAVDVAFPDDGADDVTRVAIGPNVVRVRGRGLSVNPGKTRAALRRLSLPPFAAAMLAERAERNPAAVRGRFPVFGSRTHPERLRDPSDASGALRRAFDRAGYEWVTSHVFRKTVATMLDERRKSARAIADQLGHARPSLTMDVYMARGTTGDDTGRALDDDRDDDGDDGVVEALVSA